MNEEQLRITMGVKVGETLEKLFLANFLLDDSPFEVKPFISTHQVVDLDPNEWRVLPRAALPERTS